jgi:hypothetical protein
MYPDGFIFDRHVTARGAAVEEIAVGPSFAGRRGEPAVKDPEAARQQGCRGKMLRSIDVHDRLRVYPIAMFKLPHVVVDEAVHGGRPGSV